MDKVHFLLGVHNHQPIGNFDFVFEKAYQQSYLPFLEAMERHPRLHWNMHAPGILWEWLEAHHPDYVDRVAQQVDDGRLELLGGGYYEPILPILPDADKSGQIQKLTQYIQKRFKTTPRGMWLAERVWEPHLAKVLHDNRIHYTLVDDSHFLSTGMTDDQLDGPFLTEDQGAPLTLLPISKTLRYAIPFRDPGETLNLLRRFVTPTAYRALVMFDDGEKFGLWPGTHKHVYEDGWLERFLTVLESNADWILCSRISDYLEESPPHGRVYIPSTSYYEMSEWTLPAESQEALAQLQKSRTPQEAEAAKPFLHGGFWRNFLTKYEEANSMHKKMLWVSKKVHRAVSGLVSETQRTPGRAQKMLDALWAGQCNCAYWHGVFGGLYLPHLRQAVYRQLIEAETLAEKSGKAGAERISQHDINADGQKEVLIESSTQNVYINPHEGGSIYEWDLRGQGVNLLNVLTRRLEGYHKQLVDYARRGDRHEPSGGGVKTIHDRVHVKEPGLEKRLFTDWYRRASLLDHFLHRDTTLDDFYRCQYGEQGDYVRAAYGVEPSREKLPEVRLSRLGTVWSGEQRNSLLIEKVISLAHPAGWQVAYRIKNVEGPRCEVWFGSELNFAFSSQDAQEPINHGPLDVWQRRDHGFGLALSVRFDHPMDCWDFPLETISLSEEGFERTYQGTALLVHQRLVLAPGQSENRSWSVEVVPE